MRREVCIGDVEQRLQKELVFYTPDSGFAFRGHLRCYATNEKGTLYLILERNQEVVAFPVEGELVDCDGRGLVDFAPILVWAEVDLSSSVFSRKSIWRFGPTYELQALLNCSTIKTKRRRLRLSEGGEVVQIGEIPGREDRICPLTWSALSSQPQEKVQIRKNPFLPPKFESIDRRLVDDRRVIDRESLKDMLRFRVLANRSDKPISVVDSHFSLAAKGEAIGSIDLNGRKRELIEGAAGIFAVELEQRLLPGTTVELVSRRAIEHRQDNWGTWHVKTCGSLLEEAKAS